MTLARMADPAADATHASCEQPASLRRGWLIHGVKRPAGANGATQPMRIAEIFASLQGEGLLAGTPSTFIRTSGCNLRCVWCDTPYTSWSPEGETAAALEQRDRASQRNTERPRAKSATWARHLRGCRSGSKPKYTSEQRCPLLPHRPRQYRLLHLVLFLPLPNLDMLLEYQ